MQYNAILEALNQASLFELFRLNSAINVQLKNSKKISNLKKKMVIGMSIQYFNSEENRLIEANLVKINKTRVLLQNKHDHQQWHIPFYMINLEKSETNIDSTSPSNLDRNSLKVGDSVCFQDKQGCTLSGTVYRLNLKTAGLMVGSAKWRVAYDFLSLVIDGQINDSSLYIEGDVNHHPSPKQLNNGL